LPSYWISLPTAVISPAVPFLPTQYGGVLVGCVGWPSGTPRIVSAAVWKLPFTPVCCSR
jgi:hypothetical protein